MEEKGVQEVGGGPPIGRVTSRLIATARGSVLYSVVVYYARRSGRGIREPLSIQNSYTGSVYARVVGQAGEDRRSNSGRSDDEKEKKKEGRGSAVRQASTTYEYVPICRAGSSLSTLGSHNLLPWIFHKGARLRTYLLSGVTVCSMPARCRGQRALTPATPRKNRNEPLSWNLPSAY